MTFHNHPTAAPTRELDEITDLIASLTLWQKQLEVRASAVRELGKTSYQAAICADRAEEAKARALLAAYRLFEIDELHTAYLDQCADCGVGADDLSLAPVIHLPNGGIAA